MEEEIGDREGGEDPGISGWRLQPEETFLTGLIAGHYSGKHEEIVIWRKLLEDALFSQAREDRPFLFW